MGKLAHFLGVAALAASVVHAEPPIPPVPARHVEDRAGFLDAASADRLGEKLAAFEKQSGHQVVVAIYPGLQGAVLEDFTVRTAQKWQVGRRSLSDGAVLFVFVDDHAIRLEVGYGLEEKIPDAIASRIVNDVVIPRIRDGRRAEAIEAGVDAILKATTGDWTFEGPKKDDVPYGDVPKPPPPGFHDDAGLLSAHDAERVRAAVEAFTRETGQPLVVQRLAGTPGQHGNDDAEVFAFRSHLRARFEKGDDTSDAAIERALADPGLALYVFVVRRQPPQFASGFYGPAYLSDTILKQVETEILLPRLPLAPAEALLATIDTTRAAHEGRWTPPPPRDPFQWVEQREEERIHSLPPWLQFMNRLGRHEWFPPAVLAVLALLFVLAVRKWGFARVMAVLASGGGSGRSYSSGGSSSGSSFSGGGGSFGGGGASGRW